MRDKEAKCKDKTPLRTMHPQKYDETNKIGKKKDQHILSCRQI